MAQKKKEESGRDKEVRGIKMQRKGKTRRKKFSTF